MKRVVAGLLVAFVFGFAVFGFVAQVNAGQSHDQCVVQLSPPPTVIQADGKPAATLVAGGNGKCHDQVVMQTSPTLNVIQADGKPAATLVSGGAGKTHDQVIVQTSPTPNVCSGLK